MLRINRARRSWTRLSFLALLACSWPTLAGEASADIVLFAASTDNTGGLNPISVPNNNNIYIPAIDPAVTITPNPALLDGNAVGPLNGITYGPTDGNGDTGGTTGFVTAAYTIPTDGEYRLVWEVSNTAGAPGNSALATDNVLINGTSLYNFQAGGLKVLPNGLTGAGTFGTSAAVAGLAPSGGDAAFAWIDSTGGQTPIFDPPPPVGDGNSASQLFGANFFATAGSSLELDAAFLTNDGGPFADYGIVVLQSVPEPSSLVLAGLAAVGPAGHALRRRATAPRVRGESSVVPGVTE
jgi:PEP-CTERM motif